MQNTKVILAIDRAGVVGEDGKTHQGVFDVAYLQTIPNITVYSPAYFKELRMQLSYLVEKGTGLCAIRYPRGKELYKPGALWRQGCLCMCRNFWTRFFFRRRVPRKIADTRDSPEAS